MATSGFSRNSFDLIRLFAALQVALSHSVEILSSQYARAPWMIVLQSFPGVPTFFFISGFLISRSYERNPVLADYARNRSLRIFPALEVCLLVNLLLVAATGYFARAGVGFRDVATLFVAKGTFFQFYNPEFMRSFGDGVLNGSLWTICVELQFYFLIPIFYRLFGFSRKSALFANLTLGALIILSLVCNRVLYLSEHSYANSVYWKLLRVSFLPWLCMFLCGVLAQRNLELFRAHLKGRYVAVALAIYIPLAYILHMNGVRFDNGIFLLTAAPLFAIVLLVAYGFPAAADFLNKNDISYGVYIYHMVIVNMLLYYGWTGSVWLPIGVCVLSIAVASISWLAVERPSLARKERPLKPVAVTG